MHFTYLDEEDGPSSDQDLRQGDILRKSDSLALVISEFHPYYDNKKANRDFLVLTQSCDLVRGRGQASACKARYISLAPVRPLSEVLERFIGEQRPPISSGDLFVCSQKSRDRLNQFLQRLFNNNESDYFYLHSEPTKGLGEDSCAFLRLSISIRAPEHYEKCLKSRYLSLSEPFRAKLGWLVGQLFSRVATQDWDSDRLKDQLKKATDDAALWIEDKKLPKLKERVASWKTDNPNQEIDADVISELLQEIQIPDRKESLVKRISELISSSQEFKILKENGHLTDSHIDTLIKKISIDAKIASILK